MKKIRILIAILFCVAACGKTEVDIKPPPTCPPCKPVVSHLPLVDAVYFVDSYNQRIHQYRLNAADPSNPIPMLPPSIETGENPANLIIHPTKKWAYLLSVKDHVISVYDINQLTGHITIAHNVQANFKQTATHLVMDLDGKRLYAVSDIAAPVFHPYAINEQNGLPDYIGN